MHRTWVRLTHRWHSRILASPRTTSSAQLRRCVPTTSCSIPSLFAGYRYHSTTDNVSNNNNNNTDNDDGDDGDAMLINNLVQGISLQGNSSSGGDEGSARADREVFGDPKLQSASGDARNMQHEPTRPSSSINAPPQQQQSGITELHARDEEAERYQRIRKQQYTQTVNETMNIRTSQASVEWMCVMCQTYNFLGRKSCRKCGVSDAQSYREHCKPTRHVATLPATWLCEMCGATNKPSAVPEGGRARFANVETPEQSRSKFFCGACDKPFGGVKAWYCPLCAHLNPKAATQCATCYYDRPSAWDCVQCGASDNSVFLTCCRSCQAAREQKKESASAVSCTACGCLNDVRWEICESCMAPLPSMIAAKGKTHSLATETQQQQQQQTARSSTTVRGLSTPPPTITRGAVSPLVKPQTPPAAPVPITHEQTQAAAPPTPSAPVELQNPSATPVASAGANELAGAWWCSACNILLRRNATYCDVCLQTKEQARAKESQDAAAHTTMQQPLPTTGSWQCPYCRQYCGPLVRACCDKPREVPQGYWICGGCASINRSERHECLGCGKPPLASPWLCAVCAHPNERGVFLCDRCWSPHPTQWVCAACDTVEHKSKTVCGGCGQSKPAELPAPLVCPTCQAPNNPERKSCYRCRTRLYDDDQWTCTACAGSNDGENPRRCGTCNAPRQFNNAEQIWICDVCSTAVTVRGDLPDLVQCPRCTSDRSADCLAFPSRWTCASCGVWNRTANAHCEECSGPRRVSGLHSSISCPTCFRMATLDASEKCSECGGSLSQALTDASGHVSVGNSIDANYYVRQASMEDVRRVAETANNNNTNVTQAQQEVESKNLEPTTPQLAANAETPPALPITDGSGTEDDCLFDDEYLPIPAAEEED